MDPNLSSRRLPRCASRDSDLDHSSSFLTTVIRRDQMPEDLRSEFLPEDVILINEPRGTDSTVDQTLAQARRRLAAVKLDCPWCEFHDTCRRVITALAGLLMVEASMALGRPSISVLALYVCSYVLTGPLLHMKLGIMALELLRHRSRTSHRARRGCSRDIRKHRLASLARCVLSPTSMLLLQQPMVNTRSFIRYYLFFTGAKENSSGVAQKEVDSCIRHYTAQGALAIEALAVSGTGALLGLEPCREEFTYFGYCLSRPTLLYQNYRDWKRWRLATVICERIQGGESRFLPLSIVDGHDPFDELEGRGDHKWLLVNPTLFSSRLRRRLGGRAAKSRTVTEY